MNKLNNAKSVYESPTCETTEIQIEGAILQNSLETPNDKGGYPWDIK